jgi:hypothetical protein
VTAETGLVLPCCPRPPAGVSPPLDCPHYRSTLLRAPKPPPGTGRALGFDIRLHGERETVFFDV